MKTRTWPKAVAALAVAVTAASGVVHQTVPTPPATGCVQIVRVA